MAHAAILVMGVAGSGKTTVARAVADALGAPFVEADAYHPPENIAAMSRGHPLDDSMRWGWLDAVAEAAASVDGTPVVACSALKRRYRDRLRDRLCPMLIVYLVGDRALLTQRMGARTGHYMPVSLLDSQFADLEPPGPDEDALSLDVAADPATLVTEAVAHVRQRLREEPADASAAGRNDDKRGD